MLYLKRRKKAGDFGDIEWLQLPHSPDGPMRGIVEKGGKSPQAIAPPPVSQAEPPAPPPVSPPKTNLAEVRAALDRILLLHVQDPLERAKLAMSIAQYLRIYAWQHQD